MRFLFLFFLFSSFCCLAATQLFSSELLNSHLPPSTCAFRVWIVVVFIRTPARIVLKYFTNSWINCCEHDKLQSTELPVLFLCFRQLYRRKYFTTRKCKYLNRWKTMFPFDCSVSSHFSICIKLKALEHFCVKTLYICLCLHDFFLFPFARN